MGIKNLTIFGAKINEIIQSDVINQKETSALIKFTFLAFLIFQAQIFCQTSIEVAIESPIAKIITTCNTFQAAQNQAIAFVQNKATIQVTIKIHKLLAIISIDDGYHNKNDVFIAFLSGIKSLKDNLIQYFQEKRIKNHIIVAIDWLINVVIADQITQNFKVQIKKGFNKKLIIRVNQTINIGIFGLHIHLMIDWNIKNENENISQIKFILTKETVCESIFSSTQIIKTICLAKINQITHKNIDVNIIISSVCRAIWLTFCHFFAPKYCAIKIDQAIDNQLHNEIVKKITIQATVTVATASAQRCHIQ